LRRVERDAFGAPKFKKSTGLPSFTLRGHDVEEFVGVVRRYGAAAAGVQAMIDAAAEGRRSPRPISTSPAATAQGNRYFPA